MDKLRGIEKGLKIITIIIGIGNILIGLTYILGMYGPTEVEVGYWGLLSILLGVLLIGIGQIKDSRLIKMVKIFLILLIMVIQILPIVLWFEFHGYGISDGTPPSDFIAHWGYSIPHILILMLCIYNIFQIQD